MDGDKGEVAVTIIALVIGVTSITMLIVCFHIKKARRENNASDARRSERRTLAERQQERYRQILREHMERELSMQQNPVSQADPPSYNVAIDVIDPQIPPPSYHDHRRDTRITQIQRPQ